MLDLFAGTGSIGFEFLSRGVQEVLAVERNVQHVAFIKKVQAELGAKGYRVLTKDVLRFIREYSDNGLEPGKQGGF